MKKTLAFCLLLAAQCHANVHFIGPSTYTVDKFGAPFEHQSNIKLTNSNEVSKNVKNQTKGVAPKPKPKSQPKN